MDKALRNLIQAIHDSPPRAVFAAAGAGSQALADLLGVPGGSRTLLEALIPYAADSFDEFLGQTRIVGPGTALRGAIERDALRSVILWGPPGCGKTTLARIVATRTRSTFVPFSAVLAGIKEVREVMERAASEVPPGSNGLLAIFSNVMDVKRWVQAPPSFVGFDVEDPTRTDRRACIRAVEEQAAFGTLTVVFALPAPPVVEEVRAGWDPAADADAAAGTLIKIVQRGASFGIWFSIVVVPFLAALAVLIAAVLVARRILRRAGSEATV